MALSSDLESRIVDSLQQCDKRYYYIFVQDHVQANQLKDSIPKLQGRIAEARSHVVEIPEVVANGGLSAESIVSRLEKACEAKGKSNKACRSRTGLATYGSIHANCNLLPSVA